MPTPRSTIAPAAEIWTTDPIFAAIKAHQAAWDLAREASDDDIDALMDGEAGQLSELLRMTPTTIAGCAAMMRWADCGRPTHAALACNLQEWRARRAGGTDALQARPAATVR